MSSLHLGTEASCGEGLAVGDGDGDWREGGEAWLASQPLSATTVATSSEIVAVVTTNQTFLPCVGLPFLVAPPAAA